MICRSLQSWATEHLPSSVMEGLPLLATGSGADPACLGVPLELLLVKRFERLELLLEELPGA